MNGSYIKDIWETARSGDLPTNIYSLEDIRKYRSKKSQQTSVSGRWSILIDIFIKGLVILGMVYLLIFLNNQTQYKYIIGFVVVVGALLIVIEINFLSKLKAIRETDSVIDNLTRKLNYFKRHHKYFIFISALSAPMFVFTGSFLYYYFKYNEIRLESPVEDPVIYLFLIAAFTISFFSQMPLYKLQLKELKESIEEMDDTQTASIKIKESRERQRRNIIISAILILAGILLLLLALIR